MTLSLSLSYAGAKDKGGQYLKEAEKFAGSSIVKKKGCVTCHTIGKSGGTVGPILNQISNRRTETWLRKWFNDPNSLKPGTKMPNFQFSKSELDELISYLVKMKKDIDGARILSAFSDPVEAGQALFEEYNCSACHRIGKSGRFVGPNLTWVGHRKSQEWEATWLADPPAYKPGTFMPDFQFSQDEIDALTAFLHSLQGQDNEKARDWESTTSFILDARPRARGLMVAERLACWSCHGENLAGGIANPNANPNEEVPAINGVFLDFDEADLRALILEGSTTKKLLADGPPPPYNCPPWNTALTESELDDLLAYLESIVPEEDKWEFE